jgi:hypothetical protein
VYLDYLVLSFKKKDRQYRVPTFALPKRGGMLFMFSKDPAALLGFRDSFVFLKKNKKLQKVHISNEEKGYLVDENLLRSTFRTREISVVTARSVFKHFGHRIVKKGKKGRDDYYFTEEEYEESEEEEPENHHHDDLSIATTAVPITTAAKNRNMNTNLIPSNFQYNTNINELNWIHCAAVSARQFSTSLFMHRRNNPINYDLLTNVYQVQQNMQTQDND